MPSEFLSTLWTWLVQPSPHLPDAAQRQSRFLALLQLGALVILLPLALFAGQLYLLPLWILICYSLNRLRYVAAVTRLTIYGSAALILFAVLQGDAELLIWLIVPLWFSLALSTLREQVVFAGLLLLATLFSALLLPGLGWRGLGLVGMAAVISLAQRQWREVLPTDSIERILGEQEQTFRLLIENSPDFVYIWKADTARIPYFNHDGFLGYSREELATPGLLASVIHEEDWPALNEHWQTVLRGGSTSPVEYRVRHKQGHWEWLERQSMLLADDLPDKGTQVLVVLRLITVRKARELELRQQEARNRALLGAIPDMIVRMDHQGYYREVWPFKEASARRPEQSYDQLVGQHILDVLEAEVAQQILDRIQLTLDSNETQSMTYALNEEDGRRFYEAHWVRYGENEVLATIRDVTSRKEDEDRLQREANIFRHVVEAIIVTEMVDNEPYIVNMNEAAQALYGWKLEEVRGRLFTEVIRPQYDPAFPREKVRETLTRQGHWAAEVLHHHRDGRIIPVYNSSSMWFDSDGQPRGVVTISLDLTQQKETEAERRRIQSLLQTLIDNVPILVWAMDSDGTITMCEGQGQREMGQASNEILGQSAYQVFLNEPRMLYSIERVLSGESFTAFHEREGIQFQTHFHPVYDLQGKINGLVAVTIDLSERTHLERNRLDLALERERITMLQRFMGDVSHDFKTPLTSIKLSLHLLSRANTAEDRQRHLDVLNMQASRLETFMSDLFNMSRFDRAETNEFDFAPLNFNDLIQDIVTAHQPLAEEKRHHLTWEPGNLTSAVLGDRVQLDRVMTNLLMNAIIYTTAGGEISLRTQQQEARLLIEVQDNGPGIPAEDHERIFQRFYRGDPARSTERGGMGLGLSIARKIVEAHGGTISLASTVGEGSTFRISLPCAAFPPT